MESPKKAKERFKFPSFEHFVVRTEQKENPRRMPYITCSAASVHGENARRDFGTAIEEELIHLFQQSAMDKKFITLEPQRKFLETSWRRDNFLYFNGVYFPYRWVDTQGRVRPEREALVLDISGIKETKGEHYMPRILTDLKEWTLAVGEGGLYFPDHDNNTLLISEGILEDRGVGPLMKKKFHGKIEEIHKKIFGDDIQIIILPQPDNGSSHIDTHISVIPRTKMALVEYDYYQKLSESGELKKLMQAGYETIQIPKNSLKCPLNILYLENDAGKTCAFINPAIPQEAKDMLREHDLEVTELNKFVASVLDEHEGGIRCVTNELHSKDTAFLRKLGFK